MKRRKAQTQSGDYSGYTQTHLRFDKNFMTKLGNATATDSAFENTHLRIQPGWCVHTVNHNLIAFTWFQIT